MRIETVSPNETFWQILSGHTKRPIPDLKAEYQARVFMALDPGETTGVAVWCGHHAKLFQLETKDVGQAFKELDQQIAEHQPDHLRYEEYRIYNWMADSHSWSVLHTPQLIGAIKVLASLRSLPISCKLAQQPKAVWNDNVLKLCATYEPGLKHARDACRHLFYYMAIPDKVD